MEAVANEVKAPMADKVVKESKKGQTDKKKETVPARFIGCCVTDNAAGERTLSAIGRIAKTFATSSGDNRDRLRQAFQDMLDGVCQQRLTDGITIETVLTTSAMSYQAKALDNLVK